MVRAATGRAHHRQAKRLGDLDVLGMITQLAVVFHVGGGTIALIAGCIAISVQKGGRLHRKAGKVFVAAMLVMAVFAAYLAVVIPDQLVNLFISLFTTYLVVTSWLAIRRPDGVSGLAEKIGLLVAVVLCAPFAILSFQLATGLEPLFKSAMPFKGAILIAIYSFTGILMIAVISDIKLVVTGEIRGTARISRHIWRMCLGLTLATGSAFTNGLARLLPGPYHVPTLFFYPQFVPVGLLFFWMIRVRFFGWKSPERPL
jgi:uncharacterized membrane protein